MCFWKIHSYPASLRSHRHSLLSIPALPHSSECSPKETQDSQGIAHLLDLTLFAGIIYHSWLPKPFHSVSGIHGQVSSWLPISSFFFHNVPPIPSLGQCFPHNIQRGNCFVSLIPSAVTTELKDEGEVLLGSLPFLDDFVLSSPLSQNHMRPILTTPLNYSHLGLPPHSLKMGTPGSHLASHTTQCHSWWHFSTTSPSMFTTSTLPQPFLGSYPQPGHYQQLQGCQICFRLPFPLAIHCLSCQCISTSPSPGHTIHWPYYCFMLPLPTYSLTSLLVRARIQGSPLSCT
jgi:hypothetical protein